VSVVQELAAIVPDSPLEEQTARDAIPTMWVAREHAHDVLRALKQSLGYRMLYDLTAVDERVRREPPPPQTRDFTIVYHLLSYDRNADVRVKVPLDAADASVPTITDLWPAANWYEREAFDLFGIVFEGHPDLRRILTDYGFIGHPFRKDFPTMGDVEMRYDPDQKRVIYQPVTIEPREIVPRIVRVENYGDIDVGKKQ